MTVTEKAAYIKGLAEGLGLEAETKQDKILKELIDLVSDMALTIDDVDAGLDELYEQVEEIDEDLANLEEAVYCGDECDCDCDCDDCHDECDCGCGDKCDCEEESFQAVCPSCNTEFNLDEIDVTDAGTLTCPNCGVELDIDFDEDGEEAQD